MVSAYNNHLNHLLELADGMVGYASSFNTAMSYESLIATREEFVNSIERLKTARVILQ